MKRISISYTGGFIFLLAIAVFSNGCFKNITKKYLLYENDFELGSLRGLEAYDTAGMLKTIPIVDFNGSKVLGRFNNNTVLVSFFNIPSHNSMQVEFTLNIHDKWEGNLMVGSLPDIWQMEADHSPLLLTTFSNNSASPQSYPNFYQSAAAVPAKTNAFETDLQGVCQLQGVTGGSSSYKIVKIFPHALSNFTFSINDALQPYNSKCLKSWSIDNLIITAIRY